MTEKEALNKIADIPDNYWHVSVTDGKYSFDTEKQGVKISLYEMTLYVDDMGFYHTSATEALYNRLVSNAESERRSALNKRVKSALDKLEAWDE